MQPYVHCIIHGGQDMETTKCPALEDWVRRCGTTHNGTLLSRKKRRNTVICDNMEGP